MPHTLLTAWATARRALSGIGLDTPVFDARLLLEEAAGVSRLDILTDPYREISEEAAARLEGFLARRAAREPVAQILGYKHFRTHRFAVTRDVLTPRPETELLVDVALSLLPEGPARVLDLGVGSGAIVLSLLIERPELTGVGVDASAEALAVAQANAEAAGVADRLTLIQGDWGAGLEGSFDLVVSNPPYIRSGALGLLEPEVVKYEPFLALDGGQDGYDAYRRVLPDAFRLLKPGGAFAVEVGQGQAEGVWAHADQAGLEPEGVRDDYAGIGRIVYGRRPQAA